MVAVLTLGGVYFFSNDLIWRLSTLDIFERIFPAGRNFYEPVVIANPLK